MLTNYATITDAIDATTRAAGIIRAGLFVVRKAELGKCIFTVQGFAMKSALGDFVEEGFGEAVSTYDQIAELNEAVNSLAEVVGYQHSVVDGFGKVDWRSLFQKVLPLVIKYLPEILPLFLGQEEA